MNKASYEKVEVTQELNAMIAHITEASLSGFKQDYIPAHWHRSIECSLILEGEVELWTNNHKDILKKGDFIFVNSGQVHKIMRSQNHLAEVLLVIISYDFLKKVLPNIDCLYFDLRKHTPRKKRIYEIYESFKTYTDAPGKYDMFMINGYIYELLYILLNDFQVDSMENNKDYLFANKQQHKVLDYIEEHYKEDLSLMNMAMVAHMSEEHFSRSFHELYGMNFKSYLTKYRLYCCHDDVIDSLKTMQTIALEYGFSSIKTFIKAFKEAYKMTPYQYRKQHEISKKGNFSVK